MEEEYYTELGNVIRSIRRARNISQEYMAYKLNISQNVYSKIENGKCRCTVYRFVSIMNLLDADPQDFLGRSLSE